MNLRLERLRHLTRRHFFSESQAGLGAIALGVAARRRDQRPTPPAVDNPLAPKQPHFAPKAKRVIYLHLTGSPPHLDLFDYKPELVKHNGQPCPDAFLKGKRFAFTSGVPKLLGTPRKFAQHGKSGVWMSDALPAPARRSPTSCASSSRCTPTSSTTPRPSCCSTPARRGRAGRRWARG